jgi:prepilin-type N-terminal cleavage/methylation domain-containing protein
MSTEAGTTMKALLSRSAKGTVVSLYVVGREVATTLMGSANRSYKCGSAHFRGLRSAYSLLELMVVLTMISVLMAISVPLFHRAVEESRASMAAANLRAVWAAERIYWLDNRTYTSNFSDLQPLLDPSIPLGTQGYSYAITASDNTTFTVTATRIGSSTWSGHFSIDQTGLVSGTIQALGVNPITPSFQ